MTQEQLLNGFVWVVICGFIVAVWAWQTLRPYFLFSGTYLPEFKTMARSFKRRVP